jgi:mannan endo-1,4-beta-mannosidase
MMTRRAVLGAAAAAGACNTPAAPSTFVAARPDGFVVEGAPYRFAGANLWYGAYLGANDRARLARELDRLASIGVDNLRVLGASELSPLRNSLAPAFRSERPPYNETLLQGLDALMAEMGARAMRAVVYLGNFWEWSGGMATYVSWTNGGRFIDMNDPAHPWPAFADFSAEFYANQAAVALYRHYVGALVTRTNSITRVAYRDDPTIMTWQLANEPRPAGGEAAAQQNMSAYLAWIRDTARLIKSLDPNHLVSTGSEGLMGCMESVQCVRDAHEDANIDYLTAHIWPQNWSWVDPADLAGTFANAEARTRAYIGAHIDLARALGKPLVIEEFGFPRDGVALEPGTPVTLRDRFYDLIQSHVRESAAAGGPLAGSNFWAWGGEGRAQHPDLRMRAGDVSYVGDPPHEPQGWYSVFDADQSTIALISAHASALRDQGRR